MSQTQDIVTKINILLQEFCDIKVQNQRKDIVRVVKPNLLFCVHQRNSEGVCRGEGEFGRLSRL